VFVMREACDKLRTERYQALSRSPAHAQEFSELASQEGIDDAQTPQGQRLNRCATPLAGFSAISDG
jgi:hypothetical protein